MFKQLTCADLCMQVIACLDVRSNDSGDLVVTKGDQYDVREKSGGEVSDDEGLHQLISVTGSMLALALDTIP